ncbi:MAG TPA: hypothetical protein VND15_01460 [Candidatus Acidoferrales bacterium]|nr:hypothetical protein [Candidatus Acidoferrales bacterium]
MKTNILALFSMAFTVLMLGAGQLAFAAPMAMPTANATASGGFLNSGVVTFQYTANYTCNPAQSLQFNTTEARTAGNLTQCGVGATSNTTGAYPLWVAIPAYAGLSIFGLPVLGATSQGFPTYQNNTIVTDCGAGLSSSACPMHPALLYSPVFTAVEQHINATKTTWFGLPEGVLPTPAHSHIVASDYGGANVPWYVIGVLVLDPNIMPNATTGTCTQVIASNLTNATGNCLTSYAALQRALTTQSNDVAVANAGNPIYQTLAGNKTISVQVIVPGAPVVTMLANANTNLDIPFVIKDVDYYTSLLAPIVTTILPTPTTVPAAPTTVAANTSGGHSMMGGMSTAAWAIAIVVVIIVVVAVAYMAKMRMRKK